MRIPFSFRWLLEFFSFDRTAFFFWIAGLAILFSAFAVYLYAALHTVTF